MKPICHAIIVLGVSLAQVTALQAAWIAPPQSARPASPAPAVPASATPAPVVVPAPTATPAPVRLAAPAPASPAVPAPAATKAPALPPAVLVPDTGVAARTEPAKPAGGNVIPSGAGLSPNMPQVTGGTNISSKQIEELSASTGGGTDEWKFQFHGYFRDSQD